MLLLLYPGRYLYMVGVGGLSLLSKLLSVESKKNRHTQATSSAVTWHLHSSGAHTGVPQMVGERSVMTRPGSGGGETHHGGRGSARGKACVTGGAEMAQEEHFPANEVTHVISSLACKSGHAWPSGSGCKYNTTREH